VRNIFIQAGDRFTAANVRAVRTRSATRISTSGILIRSEVFALEETAISSGTRYSTVTLTLRAKAEESMNTLRCRRTSSDRASARFAALLLAQ
jgi:hypothetical protein